LDQHVGMFRPSIHPGPLSGLLRAEHFQMAYATNDIRRAKALMETRYGVKNWTRFGGPTPQGGSIHVELAWVGTIMYELMTAQGPGSAIYMDRLAASDDFQMKHHHLGYLVDTAAQWAALMAHVSTQGHVMPHYSAESPFAKSCFVDAPELGHYLEYIFPEPVAVEFFRTVASN
jgi:Glyoxalase/Bleomycin resistance protein/Dioxygenase superfamily